MAYTPKANMQTAVDEFRRNAKGQVVLVLQGGGALGAYQVGVYHALHEAGVEPDWIVGTSIGAINASIIAGNKSQDRLSKLDQFWKRMERPTAWPFAPAWTGISDAWSYWSTLVNGIPGFFKPNLPAFWSAHLPLGADRAGFYSTAALRETLAELVDFSIINRGWPRLTVGAANVRTSMMCYFDSRQSEITSEQIMASGALPPAFPAIPIDGEYYWDGGILSNTPTEVIFDDNPRRNSLIFAVHLWNPEGPVPQSIWEILHRQKDIPVLKPYCEPHHPAATNPSTAPRHQPTRSAFSGRGAQQRGSAGTRRLWVRDADARRAPPGAAPRKREPHQRYRFQSLRNSHAPRSRLRGYDASPPASAVAGRV
jgi:NTE family protein